MLEKEKMDRIGYLSKKSKDVGLTDEEKVEQKTLREEYLAMFRKSFKSQLDTIKIVRPDDDLN